ncbi:molybdate ABC transporter substrate-binding protein [Marinicella litoralis]|uniref:Molybdate transport system substrate-binding protein n=1 Tax=Marinicella litoralis TaxID=644220 RepID=A0A4R6XYK1_9GAMM|nr:molybdate ABC transporter substrate-binding protein [Marinicella litoralis]TDR23394.1 molybdate transport system substrate-binding protein [Marinicella litoralis]
MKKTESYGFSVLLILCLFASPSSATKLHVAVASNFLATAEQLAPEFKSYSDDDLLVSSGSTGMLFAQINQGAPYDVMMAADTSTPQKLMSSGLASDAFTYATGQLVLLANQKSSGACQDILFAGDLRHLAIANPKLAPYGLAAKQYLEAIGWWQSNQNKLVMGENVAQAMQMAVSENATAGLVAASVLIHHIPSTTQCTWTPPIGSYAPIEQAMVLLSRSDQQQAYQRFKTFLQTAPARKIIEANGYLISADNSGRTE